jgi:hypothetical protein
LSALIYNFKPTKKGASKRLTMRTQFGATGLATGHAPIAALLINWKRGQTGEKGLYGADMRAAIRRLIAVRSRARAYLAAGWIPAIKKLSRLAEKPSKAAEPDAEARRIQNPKGSADPATETGTIAIARIINEAVSKHSTTPDPLDKYALVALKKAVDAETKTMLEYIERKYKEEAQRAGIRTN